MSGGGHNFVLPTLINLTTKQFSLFNPTYLNFRSEVDPIFTLGPFSPLENKKFRKSREQEMLSDIEYFYLMLGRNNLEWKENESRNLGRRPKSPNSNALINQNVQSHSIPCEAEIRRYAQNGHIMRESGSIVSLIDCRAS